MKMKKLVSAIAALAIAGSAFAGFATVASADTTVDAKLVGQTTTNSGSNGVLWVLGDGKKGTEGVLLQFDASAVKEALAAGEVVSEASLVFSVQPENGANDGNFYVYAVNDGETNAWDGTSAVDMAAWNNLSKTQVANFWSGWKKPSYSVMAPIDVKAAVENDADGIITFAITIFNGRRQFIEKDTATLTIKTVGATPTTVTVNKVDADGNPISSETVDRVYVGDPYTATDAQKTVAPVEADGTKTIYAYNAAASTESIAALGASNNEITLVFDKTVLNAAGAIEVNYAIDGAVVDTKSVDGAGVYETENYSYYYPAYITNEGKLYKANASTYGETLVATADAVTKTIDYVAADDVVFFMEAEDITDITNKNTDWTGSPSTNFSNGNAVTVAKTDAYMAVTVEIAESGKYRFDGVYGSGSTRLADIFLNDVEVLADVAADSNGGSYSYEAELAAGTYTYKISANYSTLPSMDYFTVTKTGEYTPAPTTLTGTIAPLGQFKAEDGYDQDATALTVAFDTAEDVTYEMFTISFKEDASRSADIETQITGGSVVFGVIVEGLIVDAEDLVAVAK